MHTLDKLVSKELYNVSYCSMYEKPTSQNNYEKLLETTNLNSKEKYILPRKVSIDTYLRMFCGWDTVAYLPYLYYYKVTINEVKYFVSWYLYIPEITPQNALLGFLNIGNQQQNFLLINHLLLITKHYLYMSREHGAVCFANLKLY